MRDPWDDADFAKRWDAGDLLSSNPDRPNQIDLLVALLRERYRDGDRVLDLGAGSGLVEERILEQIPQANVLAIDHSEAMLSLARERHAGRHPRIEFRQLAFQALHELARPDGGFRFIICVQALHEVDDDAKQNAFANARRLIGDDGGLYVLDRFQFDNETFSEEYRAIWQRLNRLVDVPAPLDYSDCLSRYRAKTDHVARVDDYLAWLRDGGFAAVCPYQHFNRALLIARPIR